MQKLLTRNLKLRETRQERVLNSHEKYEKIWKEIETDRGEKFENYADEKETRTVQDWMHGLAGLRSDRVRRVKSSTGRHFGSQQKRSVISYVDDYNQIRQARDVVSYSKNFDRDHSQAQPPQFWYESLRGNAKSKDMSTSDRVMLTINSKIKKNIDLASTDHKPGTYSIPIRTAQHEFIARGQSALLGYKSQYRDLGIARPCWTNSTNDQTSSFRKSAVKKLEKDRDETDLLKPNGKSEKLKRHGSVPITKKKEAALQEVEEPEPQIEDMLDPASLQSLQMLRVVGINQFKKEYEQTSKLEPARKICNMGKLYVNPVSGEKVDAYGPDENTVIMEHCDPLVFYGQSI